MIKDNLNLCLKKRYYQKLKYEYKFLENKERLMTISKIEATEQSQYDDMVITANLK
jgi:hypothetical protein